MRVTARWPLTARPEKIGNIKNTQPYEREAGIGIGMCVRNPLHKGRVAIAHSLVCA